ncbi:hypothetical protein HO173_000830 [Letharia columbiana]|uniref:Zn(2)-C6 fungal-type domain-containing protein n=1 Tax=Letharia columbiana TaxID=112416 RepID=A0A8H6G615_9LECA|nr:uncharacterized protein HO173_000830 [Letharia columbiana]KAF6241036.1 hypothetical protein HO173_000830 [Letharia columbiana]
MPPKLRASCDACHSAKIKCIKTDIGCQRCDNSAGELACKYSPVVPRIYHKKSNRNHVEESQISRPSPSSESSLSHDLYGTQAAFNQDIYPAAIVPPCAFDQQVYSIGANAEPNPFFWQYLPQGSVGVPQNPNPWPSSINGTSTTTNTPNLTDAATPATAASTNSVLPPTNQPRASNTQNLRHYHSAAPSTYSPESVLARTPCNCFTQLFEAMQRMNAHAASCSPKLDVVLCANRTAAENCLTSLQCSNPFRPVSHDSVSSCATIACGLLDRILASYQAALEIFCASLDCERTKGSEEHGDERIGEHEDDEDERTTAHTTTVQLRFGTFALERSEQVLWARKIVAREAGRIQETLEGFEVEGQGVRSVLRTHLLERCKSVIERVSGS